MDAHASSRQDADQHDVARRKVNSLWFNDGNVVLSADARVDSGRSTVALFRVHKSQLSRHSKVFDDMFNLSDGMEESSELYEGAPLVHLTDPALDVALMLKSIYNPLEISSRFHFNTDAFETAMPLFHMLKKYEMADVQKLFTPHITEDWPKTLASWDRREDRIDEVLEEKTPDGEPSEPLTLALTPDPVSAILFAKTFGMKVLLPVAFYDLSRLDVRDDYDVPHSVGRPARWRALPGDCYYVLLAGMGELRRLSETLLNSRKRHVPDAVLGCQCSVGDSCADWYRGAFAKASNLNIEDIDILRHLRTMSSDFESLSRSTIDRSHCMFCCREVSLGIREVREEIWRKLPSIFDVSCICETNT